MSWSYCCCECRTFINIAHCGKFPHLLPRSSWTIVDLAENAVQIKTVVEAVTSIQFQCTSRTEQTRLAPQIWGIMHDIAIQQAYHIVWCTWIAIIREMMKVLLRVFLLYRAALPCKCIFLCTNTMCTMHTQTVPDPIRIPISSASDKADLPFSSSFSLGLSSSAQLSIFKEFE